MKVLYAPGIAYETQENTILELAQARTRNFLKSMYICNEVQWEIQLSDRPSLISSFYTVKSP